MKIPEHQTEEFSLYPEAMGALEEFLAGERTGRIVFRQSIEGSPKGGRKGWGEGVSQRGQIHQPPIRGPVLGSCGAGRRGNGGPVDRGQAGQGKSFLCQFFPVSRLPQPVSANGAASLTPPPGGLPTSSSSHKAEPSRPQM